ncbi:MAG: DUF896 domain-containing protein [Fusobacterium sp. JB021]|nr:DUF896 domain-containing protein [Fusobacterium sp. JB020]MDP0493080.1 DUF896 domain-containing protein [Fusobacterium sp. JB021]MDP0507512.1 DUF896 domain-containing protein [Fusobacterium sp. JB019]
MEMKDIVVKVNYFANLSKKRTLTEEELSERNKYRKLYMEKFRAQVKGHLDRIKIVDDKENLN